MAKKIALVTPWPPQASGIADYAYNLVSHITGPSLIVHVITNERAPAALPGVFFHHVEDISEGRFDFADFDAIIVQMGNHPHFHGYMLDIIKKYPCTVELHDLLLHHCVMGESGMSNGGGQYYKWIENAYGSSVADRFRSFLEKDGDILKCPIAGVYPCSDVVVRDADHVVVHSMYAKNALIQSGLISDISVVPLCYSASHFERAVRFEGAVVRIGVFGGIQKNRQVDVILGALGNIDSKFKNWTLELVGDIDGDCGELLEKPGSLGISEKVKFHGRLALDKLEECMSGCDIVISLRSPTMGETSGVVVRALKMGAVSIVSNVGWYSELPEFVFKIENEDARENLEKILFELLINSNLREDISRKTQDYASQYFDLRVSSDDIVYTALYEVPCIKQQ
ncbi:glycosyltransferase family 4 protein [Burkholderia contaminans]|uniref:glycosyltransferase family 4 protein n=1 Tax=Burkholderia contaminans TaxID=488447 RepID=UPI0014549C69|nr:glycosyltransferase [Burkholderia contaminans]MCA8154890.1 glycosyltransferase [Burkholderia contaminans]VWD34321.1 glycosyl transferase family 1 [Burkholderia contaminans]